VGNNSTESADDPVMRVSKSQLVFLALVAQLLGAERVTVEFQPAEGVRCGELVAPKVWALPKDADGRVAEVPRHGRFELGASLFEFRQGRQLMVGVFGYNVPPPKSPRSAVYSADHYVVVDQGGKLKFLPATEADWQAGRVLQTTIRGAGGSAKNGDPFPYAGRDFKPSQRYWWWLAADMSTRLSFDDRFLALFTWEGRLDDQDWGRIFPRAGNTGHYAFDLYSVPNGRHLALLRGRFKGFWPGYLIQKSFWIEGSRFAVTLSEDMRRLALCEVQ
jgi:hypothetical protein